MISKLYYVFLITQMSLIQYFNIHLYGNWAICILLASKAIKSDAETQKSSLLIVIGKHKVQVVQVWYISPLRGERWWCKRAVAFRQREHINMSKPIRPIDPWHFSSVMNSLSDYTLMVGQIFTSSLCMSKKNGISTPFRRQKSSSTNALTCLSWLWIITKGVSRRRYARREWMVRGFMESWSGSNSIPQGTYAPPPPHLHLCCPLGGPNLLPSPLSACWFATIFQRKNTSNKKNQPSNRKLRLQI